MEMTDLLAMAPPCILPAECEQTLAENGLTLTTADLAMLGQARTEALRESGRVELGETILPALAEALAPSPYVSRTDLAQTLADLQAIFYELKTAGERWIDRALLTQMMNYFNGAAGGSVRQCADLCLMRLREEA